MRKIQKMVGRISELFAWENAVFLQNSMKKATRKSEWLSGAAGGIRTHVGLLPN